jgi:hypothetical protein
VITAQIGLGGNELEQRAFGLSAGKEIEHLREYLTVCARSLIAAKSTSKAGN